MLNPEIDVQLNFLVLRWESIIDGLIVEMIYKEVQISVETIHYNHLKQKMDFQTAY